MCACDFISRNGSSQAAISAYWNNVDLLGQCGMCWQLSSGTRFDGNEKKFRAIGIASIVVIINLMCALDYS